MPMKRILIVTVNWLGDAVLTTPAPKALKDEFPGCFVAVMAHPRVAAVFKDNPSVDEIIFFDERITHNSFASKLEFIKQLKKKKFDTVFLIQRSFTRALICCLAGIKTRVGYWRLKNLLVLTKMVRLASESMHRQDYYLELFKTAGVTINDKTPMLFLSDSLREKAAARLVPLKKKYRYIVGLNPSANWHLKRWPFDYFAGLCDHLVKELNCAILFIGEQKEAPLVFEITRMMTETAYNFCGKTTLKELAALIKTMDIFISNDSGPAHISAGLDVSTLVIFGPTSPELTAPRGKKVAIIRQNVGCKIPCYDLECKDNICMKDITVNEVYQKAKEMLLTNENTD